jgi:hypothetical protein
MGNWACWARRSTVRYSQSASGLPVFPSTSFTPMARLAIQREMASEMKAPPMPQTKQKMAMGTRPSPGRTPSRLRMIEIVTTTATFVSMNRRMRLTMEVLILEEV